MATYKGIKGVKVQSKASDPTASEAEGTVWYNTTSNALKYAIQGAGAWASATALTVGIAQQACIGTATAALSAFGDLDTPVTANSYEYNGTSWTAGGTGNTARRNLAAAGIQTAGLAIGGTSPPGDNAQTESYNGTAWTETGDIPSGRQGLGGAGTTTAAIAFGGGTGSGVATSDTFNGTSWTASNSLNNARDNVGGGGVSAPDAMCAGGNTTTYTEKFDGTCWTEVADLNASRNEAGVSMQGTSTAFLTFGDSQAPESALNEKFDGTSWTELADLGTGRTGTRGCGTASAALCVGGVSPPTTHATIVEEWSDPAYIIKTVTVS
jgi:hypothetical protein